MRTHIANHEQHLDLMGSVINRIFELSRQADGLSSVTFAPSSQDLPVNLLRFIDSLNEKLSQLNNQVEMYGVEALSIYMTLRKSGGEEINGELLHGRTDMIAELSRITARVLLAIKKKQKLLKNYLTIFVATRLPHAQQSTWFREILDGCREYSHILEQIFALILAFAKYAGRGLASPGAEQFRNSAGFIHPPVLFPPHQGNPHPLKERSPGSSN